MKRFAFLLVLVALVAANGTGQSFGSKSGWKKASTGWVDSAYFGALTGYRGAIVYVSADSGTGSARLCFTATDDTLSTQYHKIFVGDTRTYLVGGRYTRIKVLSGTSTDSIYYRVEWTR